MRRAIAKAPFRGLSKNRFWRRLGSVEADRVVPAAWPGSGAVREAQLERAGSLVVAGAHLNQATYRLGVHQPSLLVDEVEATVSRTP
jgi:hypothetical protein